MSNTDLMTSLENLSEEDAKLVSLSIVCDRCM